MGLFGRKKTSVGLDIGSGFIKLVQVDHSGQQRPQDVASIERRNRDEIEHGKQQVHTEQRPDEIAQRRGERSPRDSCHR